VTHPSASKAYTESSVLTASPERLVVMLYDGAIRFLHQAAAAMEGGDRQQAQYRLRRADAIVDELNLSLDMTQGELPSHLRAIYLFCRRQIVEAIVQQAVEPIRVVIGLLAELRQSWDRLAREAAAQPATAPLAASA
jgi:flagellar protein FliS